jgi:hypothetical protein
MECWNAGILGIRSELNLFNCKKLLKTHYSNTPLLRGRLTALFDKKCMTAVLPTGMV